MKELTRVQTSELVGGASDARCRRMTLRYIRRESRPNHRSNHRLWNRIQKNCAGRTF